MDAVDADMVLVAKGGDGDLRPEPWMPRIQKLSEYGPVGVLK